MSEPVAALHQTPERSRTAQTSADMRAAHHLEAPRLQRGLDRITAIIGWPGFVALLGLMVTTWIACNLAAASLGFSPVDPPPFAGLESGSAIGSLMIVTLILSTQRREDQLADRRSQLTMELAISNDQKIAKIIALLEESRRDNPAITDRVDDKARAMSSPSDTDAVLEAIEDLREGTV